MRKEYLIAVTVLMTTVLVLAGCGGTATPGSAAAAASVSTAASANSAATLGGASGSQVASSGAATGSSSVAEGYSVGDPDSMFQDGAGAFTPSYTEGFYGIWVGAVKDQDQAVKTAKELYSKGFESFMAYSPEWDHLNDEAYFCVTAGRYETEAKAKAALDSVKNAGYKDAYVKFSGKRSFTTIQYINYGQTKYEVSEDKVLLKNIGVKETKTWYPGFKDEENAYLMNLVLDKTTVFDKDCSVDSFNNYKAGDTPLTWFQRNYKLMNEDPEEYIKYGPALSGIFEVGIDGGHIEMYFGSYWWD